MYFSEQNKKKEKEEEKILFNIEENIYKKQ